MKKILYVPSMNMPICYWRIESYANALLKHEKECSVNVEYLFNPESGIAWENRVVGHGDDSKMIQEKLTSAFRYFDVIIFQKIQYKDGVALISKLKEEWPNVLVLAETDDAIGDIPPSNLNIDKWKEQNRWSAEHLHISDGVICSTGYLAESCKKFNKNTHVAPNCIDWETWKTKAKKRKDPKTIRVCYSGASGHDEDLLIAYRAILPLLDKHKDVKFIVRLGGFKPKWLKPHKQIDYKMVSAKVWEWPQFVRDMQADLLLAPLRDTEFNRCKSNLKWLEASSFGIPLVASDVEPFNKTKGDIILSSNDIEDFRLSVDVAIDAVRNNLFDKDGIKAQCKRNYDLHEESKELLRWVNFLCYSKENNIT